MNSKSLMKVENKKMNIFQKIKDFFTKKFKKPKEKVEENVLETKEQKYIEKQEILELYKKYKNHEIKLSQIDREKANKIIELLKEEIKIKTKKLDEVQTEANMYKYQAMEMKRKAEKI